MPVYVLGTCGHVDHGKSTFLRHFTGMEPDRLPEERSRGMTIDLNFVWFKDAKGKSIGVVDVPGHHRFVKNMISGTMTIDAFIFILAADDGWMPQSEEHLSVLKGLGIKKGIGILTKTDLADEDWIQEVESDYQSKLSDAFGSEIKIYRFSSEKPENLNEIKVQI